MPPLYRRPRTQTKSRIQDYSFTPHRYQSPYRRWNRLVGDRCRDLVMIRHAIAVGIDVEGIRHVYARLGPVRESIAISVVPPRGVRRLVKYVDGYGGGGWSKGGVVDEGIFIKSLS